MKRAMALLWLVAVGSLLAEAPLDLSSPFKKVALVRVGSGEIEKREILKARLIGSSVEMETSKGGVAVFPAHEVLAILPQLPPGDLTCSV